MAKRSFLKPLSSVIAALASATPWATANAAVDSCAPLASQPGDHSAVDSSSAPIAVNEARDVLLRQNGDVFKFVLKHGEDGRFLADHYSHSSHSSHSSHYSSR